MHSPIPRDLKTYDDKFDFEKHRFCPRQWEISVPQKNCIIWSVVLSYLRSADFTAFGKFEERLNRLAENVFDPEAVKKAIVGYNPFVNIHKCFFDETLQKVTLSFKKFLDENRPMPKSVPQDIQMISTLLQSNILIVDHDNKSLHLVKPSNGDCTDVASIILFCRGCLSKDKKQVVTKRFTFSLNKDLCWELRQEALGIILESVEIKSTVEKEIQPLTEKKEKTINILITLLRKGFNREICELYDSPYTMSKLVSAGFETNPMLLDKNGLSAFYYALLSGDKNVVYLLHKYAANNCYESDKTFRDPDSHVLKNLLQLEKIIQNDRIQSQNFQCSGDKAEQARLASEELQLFNKFLIRTSEGILDIRKKTKDDPAKEASRLKRKVLHILEIYEEFFSFGGIDASFTESELLKNYTKHKSYYDNLDLTVSLLFFDDVFLLKRTLSPSQSCSLSELESQFVLSIVTNKYFSSYIQDIVRKCNHSATNVQNEKLESDFGSLHIFSFAERLRLRESVRTFCRILKEKETPEGDSVEYPSKLDMYDTLRDFPEIKDEFLVSRLRYFLNSVSETEPGDLKQKFVIQRALQVIGESVEVEAGNTTSIKHLLRSCLPKETVLILTELKKRLSHVKNFQPSIKFKIEQDDDLFRSIQFEIKSVKEAFEEVFQIQKVRFLEFLINRELESSQSYQHPTNVTVVSDDRPLVRPLEILVEPMSEFFIFLLDHYLKKALETVSGGLKQNFVIHPALKAIDEFITIKKCLFRGGVSYDALKVLKKARKTLSRLEGLQFPFNFETKEDGSLLKSIQAEIRLIKNEFEEVFDTKRVRLMEHLINRDFELVSKFQIDDKKAVSKRNSEFQDILDQKGSGRERASFPSVAKFCEELKELASSSEEEKIRSEIPLELKNRLHAIKNLEQDLEGGITVDLERFDSLFLERKDLCIIKKDYEKYLEKEAGPSELFLISSLLHKIRNAPNPLNILELIFEKKRVPDSQLNVLYEAICFSDESKATLNSLNGISKSPCDEKLPNLLNRIKLLQQITINERHDICFLWERAKSSKSKQYLIHKIVQRYLHESSFQASLEILLFDCLAILKNNDDFNSFWLKTSNLFNGIDVWNVLAYGHLDSIGDILDPKDLPSELVQKVLQLIGDRECIESLCDLQLQVKRTDTISKYFPYCHKLRERIVSCGNWQHYCKLLTEDPKDPETCDGIISFLEKSFEPAWTKGKN